MFIIFVIRNVTNCIIHDPSNELDYIILNGHSKCNIKVTNCIISGMFQYLIMNCSIIVV